MNVKLRQNLNMVLCMVLIVKTRCCNLVLLEKKMLNGNSHFPLSESEQGVQNMCKIIVALSDFPQLRISRLESGL